MFLIPAFLYAFYVEAWKKRFPNCDQKSLIPADSPMAAKLK
jgi:hypothetical protein